MSISKGSQTAVVDLEVLHTYTLMCRTKDEAAELVNTCAVFGMGNTPKLLQEAEALKLATLEAEDESSEHALECARLEREIERLQSTTTREEQQQNNLQEKDNIDNLGFRSLTTYAVQDSFETQCLVIHPSHDDAIRSTPLRPPPPPSQSLGLSKPPPFRLPNHLTQAEPKTRPPPMPALATTTS